MEDLQKQAQSAVQKLLQMDQDELFDELGARVQINGEDPALAASFQLEEGSRGIRADLTEFGKGFFERLSASAYSVICGSSDGNATVKKAFEKGSEAIAAAIATVLVAQLGIAAAIAAAVAALVVKLFVDAGQGELCEVWGKRIGQGVEVSPSSPA